MNHIKGALKIQDFNSVAENVIYILSLIGTSS